MIPMKTQQLVKNKIKELAKNDRWATPQAIDDMTTYAMETIESGKARDFHHAVYLAFENEYQGGSV